ncbi:MAG: hypothetical protein QOJ68_136 [Blastococcus sp.]|nr:hypothetical protein [Blastococcus sp.]
MGRPDPRPATGPAGSCGGEGQGAGPGRSVTLTRDARGWSVVSPAGVEQTAGLIEGLSLADLVAEEFGMLPEPDRSARRAARGGGSGPGDAETAATDPTAARLADLERTVRQLEHALSARVATERAIGVLAERTGTGPREAFETLRRDARNSGRPVAEIAREVVATLAADPVPRTDSAAADGRR